MCSSSALLALLPHGEIHHCCAAVTVVYGGDRAPLNISMSDGELLG